MRATLFAFTLLLLHCKGAEQRGTEQNETSPSPTKTTLCTKVGQSCEVSPGKLGTCVQRDECVKGDCMVCQSQH